MSDALDAVTITVSSSTDVRVPFEYHSKGSYAFRNLGPNDVFIAEKSGSTTITDASSVLVKVGEVVHVNLSENFASISTPLYAKAYGTTGATLRAWRCGA
jgi:hypothetical protein